MTSRNQQHSTLRVFLVRLSDSFTTSGARWRIWRLRHPLVIDILTVSSALLLFALLIADRHRLTSELGCTLGHPT
ncbi:MAG: hypothetical protein ACO3SK_09350 [Ilumatobacteraceae bacterium]